MKKGNCKFDMPPEPNFEWKIGENLTTVSFNISEKRTLLNRWKWWISIKLFLPGTYKWINKYDTKAKARIKCSKN